MNKNLVGVLVLLIVVLVAWVGLSAFYAKTDITINPNAQSYLSPIAASFDTDVLDAIGVKIRNLEVSPDEFKSLSTSQQ